MYERGVMDSIRGLEGDVRTKSPAKLLRAYRPKYARNEAGIARSDSDSKSDTREADGKRPGQYSPERGRIRKLQDKEEKMEEYADILQEDWNTLLTSEEQEVFSI